MLLYFFLSLCPDLLAHMTKTNLKVMTRKPYKQHAYLPHATTSKWHPPSIYTNLLLVKINVSIDCCTKHHEWRWAKSLTSLFLFVAARGHVNTTESHPPPFHPTPPTPLLALHEETDNWHIGLLNRRKEGIQRKYRPSLALVQEAMRFSVSLRFHNSIWPWLPY